MSSSPEYWIWLQKTLGAGACIDEIIRFFGSPEKLYEAGKAAWFESGIFSDKIYKSLVTFSPSESYQVMKACRDNGWHIVTYDDENYPPILKEIKNFPLVLYVQGDPQVLKSPFSIGIVGTREATGYGRDVAEGLSYSLAQAGCVIVSGGALGIDSRSHEGAIKAGGRTIAFLGSGLGSDYLKTNEALREAIAANGAVVSEFLPYSQPSRSTFPIRNRLISGISRGLVVIEAGVNSGSLITAKCALEQGKDVFAVPGNILNSGYMGTNNLIRDGAKAVFSVMDILEGYLDKYGDYINTGNTNKSLQMSNNYAEQETPVSKHVASEKQENKQNAEAAAVVAEEKKQLPEYASEQAAKLFGIMSEEPATADELVARSGLPVHELLSALTELEMYSLVTMHSGKRYARN